ILFVGIASVAGRIAIRPYKTPCAIISSVAGRIAIRPYNFASFFAVGPLLRSPGVLLYAPTTTHHIICWHCRGHRAYCYTPLQFRIFFCGWAIAAVTGRIAIRPYNIPCSISNHAQKIIGQHNPNGLFGEESE
ncbi:MAG: hypothetical protein ACI308_11610, partial [Muribaculaceae bacterium]